MGRMVRKQIYIEQAQSERLKARARARRVSETEIIRNGIDLALASESITRPDLRAWERQKAFMHKRMERNVQIPSEPWSREDLYEERLPR